MTAVPVLYVDLDGTVRKGVDELGRFVHGPGDVEVYPGVADILLAFKESGWRIVAITNQGGVALGMFTRQAASLALEETASQCRGAFDLMMSCYHHPDAKDPEEAACFCRKPRIGMIVHAAIALSSQYPDEFHPPHLALFIGDRDEDRQCAANAGIRFREAAEWRATWQEALQDA